MANKGQSHSPGPYAQKNAEFADQLHAFSDAIIHGVVDGAEPKLDPKHNQHKNDQTFNIAGAALVHLADVDHPERKPTMEVSSDGNVPDTLRLNFKGVKPQEMKAIAHALNEIAGIDHCDAHDVAHFEAATPPAGYSASLNVPRALIDPLLETIQGNLNAMENSDPGLRGLITSTPDGGQQLTAQMQLGLKKQYIPTSDF